MAEEDEISGSESGGNETNLSNPSLSKKSTRAGYLIFGAAKKRGGNIKKSIKAARGSNYLTPAAKKFLTTYGTFLQKRLSFNTLIGNDTSEFKLAHQAILLVKS